MNIIGSTSAEVATRLAREGVPFVLATGYGAENEIAGGLAVVDKPYGRAQIQAAFDRLFQESVSAQRSQS